MSFTNKVVIDFSKIANAFICMFDAEGTLKLDVTLRTREALYDVFCDSISNGKLIFECNTNYIFDLTVTDGCYLISYHEKPGLKIVAKYKLWLKEH